MATVTPSSYTSPLLEQKKEESAPTSTKRWSSRMLCLAALIVFIIVVAFVSYFNFGARLADGSVKNSSPAKVLMTHTAKNGKHDDTPYIRRSRTELVAEALELKESLQSDETHSTPWYHSDGEMDLIESIPFLDEDSCSESPTSCGFNQYSGYLMATNNREIHYWLVEADTEEDSMSKPLMIWTNGGPGCSGMMGLLTEQGPWRVQDDGSVTYNADTWVREVNMVFLEQPYGVGFSVVDDDKDCVAGDDNAAWDMDAVIRNFLEKFPRYMDSDVYTTAESWGGHYVPRTAWQILLNNEAGYEPHINFKGFFVGNPYTNYYENTYGFIDSLFGHGLMNAVDYDYWKSNCWDSEEAIDDSEACYSVYVSAYYSSYNSNVYALDWDQCYTEEDWTKQFRMSSHVHRTAEGFLDHLMQYDEDKLRELGLKMPRSELVQMHANLKEGHLTPMTEVTAKQEDSWSIGSDSYVPCSEYNAIAWLTMEEVQTALNVKAQDGWSVCSDDVYDDWPTSDWYRFMETFYDDIISEYGEEQDLKLMIYSGDDDSVCGVSGTQYWLNRWDGYVRSSVIDWLPWRDDSFQLGGYYTIYQSEDNTDFNALHFMTVRSAGHMVPTTQPARSLTVLKKFLYEISNYKTEEGQDGV